ncbi:hypothetical protein [Paenibacillus sp. FSL R7-0337]|uniref:hypothetical protein n=1 Tax=Paenibacillus sp. FSL R7-0337 TaxID=1926588 RepID=UPI000970153D|nr:hypothetical protein [Paenibacillus sp. FSL R7-0337]OMF94171.1 hypothetical protein BK147_16635 [Paenibacillus sp. FSL R7-0337]
MGGLMGLGWMISRFRGIYTLHLLTWPTFEEFRGIYTLNPQKIGARRESGALLLFICSPSPLLPISGAFVLFIPTQKKDTAAKHQLVRIAAVPFAVILRKFAEIVSFLFQI